MSPENLPILLARVKNPESVSLVQNRANQHLVRLLVRSLVRRLVRLLVRSLVRPLVEKVGDTGEKVALLVVRRNLNETPNSPIGALAHKLGVDGHKRSVPCPASKLFQRNPFVVVSAAHRRSLPHEALQCS